MHRPTSVKVAGIFLMAVCLLWIGDSILVAYILVDRGLAPTLQNPRFTPLLVYWGIVLAVSFWGIATGIGILRLRRWARISILALSVMAAYHFFAVALASPFLWGQGLSIGARATYLLGFVLAYFGGGALAALAIVVFASEGMDQIFRSPVGGITPGEKPAPTSPTVAESRAPLVSQRPLSALVIGTWLLCAGPLEL